MKLKDILEWAVLPGAIATWYLLGEAAAANYWGIVAFIAGICVLVSGKVGIADGDGPVKYYIYGTWARIHSIGFFGVSFLCLFKV